MSVAHIVTVDVPTGTNLLYDLSASWRANVPTGVWVVLPWIWYSGASGDTITIRAQETAAYSAIDAVAILASTPGPGDLSILRTCVPLPVSAGQVPWRIWAVRTGAAVGRLRFAVTMSEPSR